MIKLTRREFNGLIGTALLAETLAAASPTLSRSALADSPAAPAESDRLASLSLTEVSEMIHARTVTSISTQILRYR